MNLKFYFEFSTLKEDCDRQTAFILKLRYGTENPGKTTFNEIYLNICI